MKKQYKLGIIGCGFMGKAILDGIVCSEFIKAKKIVVADTTKDKLLKIKEEYGVAVTNVNKYVIENSEYVLFAVKPQNFEDVVKSFEGACPEKVISIMAGVKKASIKNSLGVGLIKVARCMPNLPCSIGSGVMGLDMNDFNSNSDDTEFIYKLFECLGTVVAVSEEKLDAVTGISGSGPAYVFMFIDSLIDAGIAQGLTRGEAETLAINTVFSSALMLHETGSSASDLIMKVCSKGGTTIEAVKVLEKNNFRETIAEAVEACVKRSKELSER